MPINPKYAEVIERNKKSQGGEHEKLPAIWLNHVGEAFKGTVTRVSEIMQIDDKFNEGKKKDAQFVDLKDITLRKLDLDSEEVGFKSEEMAAGTFMITKGGHFDAVIAALMESEQSDIPVGWTFGMRRGKDDDKRHTFSAKLDNNAPF